MSLRIVFMGTRTLRCPASKRWSRRGMTSWAWCANRTGRAGVRASLRRARSRLRALELGLNVLQFERIRRQEGLDALRALAPELFVTAAYGQILSNKVLAIPPRGTVNVHASLLPAYRGSAPINRCIMAGEHITGVTTMFTDRGVDTGDMLLSARRR